MLDTPSVCARLLTWVTNFPTFEWCAPAGRLVRTNEILCHLPVSFSFNSAARTQPLLGLCTSPEGTSPLHMSQWRHCLARMPPEEARNGGRADQQA
jgi:hypothetical protein